MTVKSRIAALAGALLLTLSACNRTDDPAGPTAAAPDPRITGTLVSDGGDGQTPTIQFQPLPDGEITEVSLPNSVGFIPLGIPVEGGVVALGFRDRGASLFRIDEAGEVRQLIRDLDDAVSLSVGGGVAAVGDCGRRRLRLVPVEGGRVRDAGGGCFGTISPDGSQVAWVQAGAVYRGPVDGSAQPTRWFVIADVPGLDRIVSPRERRPVELVWGTPGMALVVGNEQNSAVIVAPSRGKLHAIDTLGAAFMTFVRWQPGGRLLAMANGQSGGEGYLRLYDPEDRSIRTIGLHPRGFVSAAWAPDGQSLAVVSGSGFFGSGPTGFRLFIDLEGRQFGRVNRKGAFVIGWLP